MEWKVTSCYFHYDFIIANTNPELTTVFQKQHHLQVHKHKNNFLQIQISEKHPQNVRFMRRRSARSLKASSQAVTRKSALSLTNLSLQGTEGKLVLEQDIPLSEATTLSYDHLTAVKKINSTTIKQEEKPEARRCFLLPANCLFPLTFKIKRHIQIMLIQKSTGSQEKGFLWWWRNTLP